jgi:hypothetical protein
MRDRGESRRLRGYQAIGYVSSKEWPARRIDAATLVIEYDEAQ